MSRELLGGLNAGTEAQPGRNAPLTLHKLQESIHPGSAAAKNKLVKVGMEVFDFPDLLFKNLQPLLELLLNLLTESRGRDFETDPARSVHIGNGILRAGFQSAEFLFKASRIAGR